MSTFTKPGDKPAPAPDQSDQSAAGLGMHSENSERLLLAQLMNPQRVELQQKLLSLISADDFFIEQHQTIWRIIYNLREAGLASDPAAVIDFAASKNEFIGGTSYIVDMVQDPLARLTLDDAVMATAQRVKSYSMSRQLQKVLMTGVTLLSAGQDYLEVMNMLEEDQQSIRRASGAAQAGPQQLSVYYDRLIQQMTEQLDGTAVMSTVSTGFPGLNNAIGGGLEPGLNVLAGRPGMGKTAVALAITQKIGLSGRPVLIFSLEMSGLALAVRKLANHAHIPTKNIRDASLSEREYTAMIESVTVLSAAPIFIDETGSLTIGEIRSRARAFIMKYPNCVIMVDYLQMVEGNPNSGIKDGNKQVSEVSKGLTGLGKQYKVPILALAQLNRTLEQRASKRPVMSDLKESGQIEQDAVTIMFVYRDEFYNPDTADRGITEVIAGKVREGEPGVAKLLTDLSMMHYADTFVEEFY